MPKFRTTTRGSTTTFSTYLWLLNWTCYKLDSRIQRTLDKSWYKAHGNQ